jgi:hypothetical protein
MLMETRSITRLLRQNSALIPMLTLVPMVNLLSSTA